MKRGIDRPSTGRGNGLVLSVIAPCFNEEANIDLLVDRTLSTFASMRVTAELLLIDDGSSDDTWSRILHRSRNDARVRGLRHAVNRGMEGAWRSGLTASTGALVCLIDADLQNRPEDIAVLYDAFLRGGHDIIQAVRHPARGVSRCYLFSRALNTLLNLTFRMRARDNKSGFIVCHRDVLADVLRHRYHYRYFQSFLGVSAAVQGYTLGEVDTIFDQRYGGRSFLSALPLLMSARVFWELVKFRVETWATSRSATVRAGVGVRAFGRSGSLTGRPHRSPSPVALTGRGRDGTGQALLADSVIG